MNVSLFLMQSYGENHHLPKIFSEKGESYSDRVRILRQSGGTAAISVASTGNISEIFYEYRL